MGGWGERKAWKNKISFDDFSTNERVMVSWMMIEKNEELFAQIPTPGICKQEFSKYKLVYHVKINPVHYYDINDFLLEEIEINFKHVEVMGWVMRYGPLSKGK